MVVVVVAASVAVAAVIKAVVVAHDNNIKNTLTLVHILVSNSDRCGHDSSDQRKRRRWQKQTYACKGQLWLLCPYLSQ